MKCQQLTRLAYWADDPPYVKLSRQQVLGKNYLARIRHVASKAFEILVTPRVKDLMESTVLDC